MTKHIIDFFQKLNDSAEAADYGDNLYEIKKKIIELDQSDPKRYKKELKNILARLILFTNKIRYLKADNDRINIDDSPDVMYKKMTAEADRLEEVLSMIRELKAEYRSLGAKKILDKGVKYGGGSNNNIERLSNEISKIDAALDNLNRLIEEKDDMLKAFTDEFNETKNIFDSAENKKDDPDSIPIPFSFDKKIDENPYKYPEESGDQANKNKYFKKNGIGNLLAQIKNDLKEYVKTSQIKTGHMNDFEKSMNDVVTIINTYVQDRDEKDEYKKQININIKEFKNNYNKVVNEIQGALKELEKKVSAASNTYDKFIENQREDRRVDNIPRRDQNNYRRDRYQEGGGSSLKENETTIKKTLGKIREALNDKVSELENGSIDPSEEAAPNAKTTKKIKDIYADIWEKYTNDINRAGNNKQKISQAEKDFLDVMQRLGLDPLIALRLTINDRLIFVLVLLMLKSLCMSIVEMLIDNGYIKNIIPAMVIFSTLFALLLTVMIFFVNFGGFMAKATLFFMTLDGDNKQRISMIFLLLIIMTVIIIVIAFHLQTIEVETENDKILLIQQTNITTTIIVVILIAISIFV